MKTWLITLTLLGSVNIAMADEMPSEQPAKAEAAPAPAAAPAAKPMRHKARHLPRGDLRHCLELKDNDAIIRCAETGRKK